MADILIPKINGFELKRPALAPLLFFAIILLALSLFFVWSRLHVTNLEYAISSLESELRGLEKEQSRLRLEAASLRSPERIERLARIELNLLIPVAEQVVTVE